MRYADALSSFYPTFSSLPFVTSDNKLFQRDYDAESSILSKLGDSYDAATATLNLDEPDTQQLQEFVNNGWTLYVPNQEQKLSKAYAHREPSGIIWFSTEDISSSEFAQQLLDGYLNSRNYHESDGHITIFQRKDAEKSDDKTTIKLLGALPMYFSYIRKTFLFRHRNDNLLKIQLIKKSLQPSELIKKMAFSGSNSNVRTIMVVYWLMKWDLARHFKSLPTSVVWMSKSNIL